MPSSNQTKARSASKGKTLATPLPAPVTSIDKIVLEIRRFIAGAIFFNSKAAEKAGMGLTDMQVINLLQLNGPSTPSRLGEWTGLSSGGVTVALDRLEKAGYVRREPNPNDRRSSLIVLMPVHMKRLKGMYEGVEDETRQLLGTMTESDLAAVVRFFETFSAARGDGA
jgi:MarR family transcriptional regulator, organic hydroperoxide resistance regulator